MAAGETVTEHLPAAKAEPGAVAGVARFAVPPGGPVGRPSVFSVAERSKLDEVVSAAEAATGLRFSIYLGDLGEQPHAFADALLTSIGDEAPSTVLIAISPAQRHVEVITGEAAALRISDRSARLGVLSVVAGCSAGDLFGGITNGIRTLADQAGSVPQQSSW